MIGCCPPVTLALPVHHPPNNCSRNVPVNDYHGMNTIPADTSMREILDIVEPDSLRPLFKDAFRPLQRGKVLEKMVFMEDAYLLNFDGTGFFSSDKLYSDACLEKKSAHGVITFHLQAVGAAVVCPGFKEVIPLCPEIIRKQDGSTKKE